MADLGDLLLRVLNYPRMAAHHRPGSRTSCSIDASGVGGGDNAIVVQIGEVIGEHHKCGHVAPTCIHKKPCRWKGSRFHAVLLRDPL